jgi:membrane protein required for colicin V production
MTPAVFDIILAVILLLSTGIAWYRGIIREMFTIVGLGAAVFGAYKGGHLLIPQFNKWLHVTKDGGDKAAEAVTKGVNADAASSAAIEAAHRKGELLLGIISPALMAKIAAYGVSFMCVFLIMALFSFFITRSVQEMGLGVVDKILGAVFGFARGFLVIFLPFVLCVVLVGPERFPDWAKNSVSVPLLTQVYTYADEHFELGKKVEDRGNAIVLKLDKINPDKIGKDASEEEEELKQEIEHEAAPAPQKLTPEETATPPPAPMPAPEAAPVVEQRP